MGAESPLESSRWVMVGVPFDGTTTYRPGTRFGPSAIREASWSLETYCPRLNRDLEHLKLSDVGDLNLSLGNRKAVLRQIYEAACQVIENGQGWVGLGGEHLITLPVIEAYLKNYPDLHVIQFDAHADLRDVYLDERLSHATVMRRIVDHIGPERLLQVGIRSGPQSEFQWMKHHNTLCHSLDELKKRLKSWQGKPVFVTVDLDVLDPSVMPGTGTPEPGGLSYRELEDYLLALDGLKIVGFDVVELSPPCDPSGISNVTAAKVVRQCLLLSGQ